MKKMYFIDRIESLYLREWNYFKGVFSSDSSLRYSLFFGLLIRLVLAPFLGHPYDLRVFMAVGWAVANGITPYGRYILQDIFVDVPQQHLCGSFYGIGYPPLWGLFLGFLYRIFSFISKNNIYLYSFFLKIPIILGDVAAALILYRIVEKYLDKNIASKVFYFYQLCPFFILVGTIWGMFDILVFIFTILSAYLLMKRSNLSAVSLAIATSFKPYAIILAPLYSILIHKKYGSMKRTYHYFLIFFGLLVILTFSPMFIFKWPLSNLYFALAAHMTTTDFYYDDGRDYTYGAASPFNMYNVLRLVFPGIKPNGFLNYIWICGCLAIYVYMFFRSSDYDFKSIIKYSFLTSLVFFATRFWVSEQNLVLLLSFFILTVIFNGTRDGWKIIHVFSILLLAFVFIHVPAPAFLWMVQPWTLNASTAFCNGPYGFIRLILMTLFTFSWLGVLVWYSLKERIIL